MKKDNSEKEMKKKSYTKKLIMFFVLLIFIIVLIILYSYYIGTKNIYSNEYKIINSNLSNNFYGFKIAHISDIKYGSTITDKELKNLVKKVNSSKPDIIVMTGDLFADNFNITTQEVTKVTNILSKLNSNVGMYAISGNNDLKYNEWSTIMEKSGFTNLNDTYDNIYMGKDDYITISGISSINNTTKNIEEKVESNNTFISSIKEGVLPRYKLLLIHEPDIISNIETANYDLILGGHSLNGQINLLNINKLFLPENAKKYYKSYYKINTTDLYISSGIGTTNLKFRLYNHPSYNLYRLVNK